MGVSPRRRSGSRMTAFCGGCPEDIADPLDRRNRYQVGHRPSPAAASGTCRSRRRHPHRSSWGSCAVTGVSQRRGPHHDQRRHRSITNCAGQRIGPWGAPLTHELHGDEWRAKLESLSFCPDSRRRGYRGAGRWPSGRRPRARWPGTRGTPKGGSANPMRRLEPPADSADPTLASFIALARPAPGPRPREPPRRRASAGHSGA